AAAGGGDGGVGRAAGAHGEFGPAVARVDGVGVGVDEAGGDEAAAEVFDVVDVDDVVDDAGDALRQVGGGSGPDDAVVVDEHGGVAAAGGAGPGPAEVRQQPYGHGVTDPRGAGRAWGRWTRCRRVRCRPARWGWALRGWARRRRVRGCWTTRC